MSRKIEYYILAGDKGMKKLLIEKGIDISPMNLLIVSEYSEIGKLIRKEAKKKAEGGQ
jgi:hypothetical protein